MKATQQIFRVRRQYNKWVGNQTLEDYALRFTATKSRHWSIEQVAKTALGATAFLALEAIAAAVTLNYGFTNTLWALLSVSLVIFIIGAPISYYAAKYGLDIDLLTRGAGFGYLGSTITSLIYASFTFIFFAIEAAILASALKALLGIPLPIGYVICALAVIPIVTHGISAISKLQLGTQPVWLALQLSALGLVVYFEFSQIEAWVNYVPVDLPQAKGFDLALFGLAASVFFAMIAQIGEQVDYLRFMPEKTLQNRKRWWFWLVLAGPGWILIGIVKMLLGSFLAYLAITQGRSAEMATDPTYMYQMAFNYMTHSPTFSLLLAGLMVIISQMKINVTNAYAGSIAWSNFFSRLTHNHPGRVIWLVFNVLIALILMELGIYRALEAILGVFAIVALSWLACVAADLLINKRLGLSPDYGEFKRAHLYDINPVGVCSMTVASLIGIFSYLGFFGETARHLAHFISLVICFVMVPAVAWLTKGRYYLARQSPELVSHTTTQAGLIGEGAYSPASQIENQSSLQCSICENNFESADMSYCPAYQGAICSLCCTLDARCKDACKPQGRFSNQAHGFFSLFLPDKIMMFVNNRIARFLSVFFLVNLLSGAILALIYYQMRLQDPVQSAFLLDTLLMLFFILMIVFGVISWLFLLAHESREVAQKESDRQTERLVHEIEAHEVTDQSLQHAKEMAERANHAKSRYLSGISHELRTPLQSILGYAQLLTQNSNIAPEQQKGLKIIRRNGEYLTDLIEGLLDISKIEAGRMDLYRNQVVLPELLDQLVEMFSPQAEQKGIRFNYIQKTNLPTLVNADEKRVRQILINLLSNAIKYTERGQVDFEIQYSNQVAEFTVRDTGVGIDEQDLERILDPFERVRNNRVPNVTGTGLGLTIVRLFSEIMGGELTVESQPGIGSSFKVSLMLSRVDTPDSLPLGQHQRVINYLGSRKTVMVVDDEPVHRGLMADLLTPLGFTLIEATDGYHCQDLLKHEGCTPDLYLLDVSMPGMNGMVLAEKLREMRIISPIVMVSADAQERHRTPQDSSPHDDYMVKPINNQLLLDKIGTLLKIEWEYETSQIGSVHAVQQYSPEHSSSTELQPYPDHGLMRELKAYAQLGYSKGVKEALAKITGAELLTSGQLREINRLADQFLYPQLAQQLDNTQGSENETID